MTMECPVTGIKTRFGNRVSHANNKTRRTWEPNMQSKRFWVPSQNRYVRLTLSAQGIKLIDKIGIEAALKDMHARGVKA
ncbi:MAG: 50S ribosomal protein L28 [Acidobacteria bacterium]|nr:50S ribosomal protein L28 [Acidobacteriota bacterium]